jgi:hypothetical protein
MRSTTLLVAISAAVSLAIACSDDPEESTTQLPNQPSGNAGSGGSAGAPNAPSPAASGSGGTESTTPPPLAQGGSTGMNAGQNQAGTGGAAPVADAGVTPAAPDAGGPTGTPDAGDDEPDDTVTFADVFPLLVQECGNCHGAGAPRPPFAQAGNQGASFTATQQNSTGQGAGQLVNVRIIARAVTNRTMPPGCNMGQLGTGTCLDANQAALLQQWFNQGALP